MPNRSTATTLSPATVTSTVSYLSTDIAKNYLGDATLNTALNESYLSNREKAMIKEINLVRSNPQAYIQVVKAYIQYMKVKDKEWYNEEISVAKELILELEKTPKLSILLPSKEIYMAAKAHGTAAKKIGSLEHEGQDGSLPWDRVVKYDKTMRDGNENIVGGMNDIRKSVLTLLIDSGIEGRGHRKTMLKKEWTHVSSYEVGQVGTMPNMWLQLFGQAKNSSSMTSPSIPEQPAQYDAETTRFFLTTGQYRSQLNYSTDNLTQARASLERIYTALRGVKINSDFVLDKASTYVEQFCQAMDDDFNTPEAYSVLFDMAREVNRLKTENLEKASERLLAEIP